MNIQFTNNLLFELSPPQKSAYTLTADKVNGSLRYDLCVNGSPSHGINEEWDDQYDLYRQRPLRRIFSTNTPFAVPVPAQEKKQKTDGHLFRLKLSITENIGFNNDDLDALCKTEHLLSPHDITHLDVGFYVEKDVAAFLDRFPNLNSVDLSRISNLKTVIKDLVSAKVNLTSISLYNCEKLTDDSLILLALRFRDLTSLDLSACKKITERALKAVGQFCPKLSALNLSRCKISDASIEAIALPSLSSISLYAADEVSDKAVETLAKNCTELESVDIGFSYVSELSLIALAENCHKLAKLYIQNLAEAMTKKALRAFAEKGSNEFRVLDLDWISHDEFFLWAKQCKKVNQLFFWNQNITNQHILKLTDNFPELTTLHLRWCQTIDCEAVGVIAERHPNLTSINLDADALITEAHYDMVDYTLYKIALHCHELTQISLKDCYEITDAGFVVLAKGCHNLTMMTLASCNFTDISLRAFGRYCHQLKAIDLMCNDEITDAGIEALATGCPQLVFVGIQDCSKITQNALITLAKCCNELTFVEAVENSFTADQMGALRRNHPEIGFEIEFE